MFGNKLSDSSYMPNNNEPRPPLTFPPMPTPFNMEKPAPLVPEVSVLDPSLSFLSTSHGTGSPRKIIKVEEMYDLLQTQGQTMKRMEVQILRLTELQTKLVLQLEHLTNSKNSDNDTETKAEAKSDAETQTDVSNLAKHDELRLNSKEILTVPFDPIKNKMASSENSRLENGEDISTILRDLQLPTIQEASIYTNNSSKINLKDLNENASFFSEIGSDKLGPSLSQYESLSDEEEDVVQPTVTYYRNVLGNVNLLLESKEQEVPAEKKLVQTDKTLYGLSSSNLSFDTRHYLQRHGLVKDNKNRPLPNHFPYQNNQKAPEKFLDLKALKGQPKFV